MLGAALASSHFSVQVLHLDRNLFLNLPIYFFHDTLKVDLFSLLYDVFSTQILQTLTLKGQLLLLE